MKRNINKSNIFFNFILIIILLVLIFLGVIEPSNRKEFGILFILNMDSNSLYYMLLILFSLLLIIKITIYIYSLNTKNESVKNFKPLIWFVSFSFLSCVVLYACLGFSICISMSDYYTFNFKDKDITIVISQKYIRGKRHNSLMFYSLNKGVFLKPFDKEEPKAGFEKSRYNIPLNNTEKSFIWVSDTLMEMPHEENNIVYTIDLEKRLVTMNNIK